MTYRQSQETAVDLPVQLWNAVPTCAQSCLSGYISTEYSCSGSCVCNQYSTNEYTLGELSLLCIGLDCADSTAQQQHDAYNLCSDYPGAAVPRHSTLTLPSTTSASPTSAINSSTSSRATQTAATASTSTPEATTPTRSTNVATTRPSAEGAMKSMTLSSGQAVGVSFGAVAGVVALVAVVCFCAHVRRRKARTKEARTKAHDVEDDATHEYSPSGYGPSASGGSTYAHDASFGSEKHRTVWLAQWYGNQVPENRGEGSSQSINYSASYESQQSSTSMRTTSQLLPDRPGSSPPQPPDPSLGLPAATYVPATKFEHKRNPQTQHKLAVGLPSHPAAFKSKSQPLAMHASASGRQHHVAVPPSENAPVTVGQHAIPPNLQRQSTHVSQLETQDIARRIIPKEQTHIVPPLGSRPLLPIVYESTEDKQLPIGRSLVTGSKCSLLDYYTPDSPDGLCSSTPIEDECQIRRPPPAAIMISKPSYPPRAYRLSTASDSSRRTSFESTDQDDVTPPEDDRCLTPVAESPIAGIRYPKIPRSSGQAVSRSPVAQSLPIPIDRRRDVHREPPTRPELRVHGGKLASPRSAKHVSRQRNPIKNHALEHDPDLLANSTLAAKRRGHGVAHELEQGLCITNSSRAIVARQNTSRPVQFEAMQTSEETKYDSHGQLKSPMWEPKLTPSRRGQDLYLRVEAATPHETHFQHHQR